MPLTCLRARRKRESMQCALHRIDIVVWVEKQYDVTHVIETRRHATRMVEQRHHVSLGADLMGYATPTLSDGLRCPKPILRRIE